MTAIWQLPTLPRVPEYWRATPTEAFPCLAKPVSSKTNTPSPSWSLGQHLLHPLPVEVRLVPLHVGEQPLQALFAGAGDGLGDGIAVLVGQLGEQPRRIALQGFRPFWPSEAHLEGPQKLFQLRQLGRTGMDVHGHPPFARRIPRRTDTNKAVLGNFLLIDCGFCSLTRPVSGAEKRSQHGRLTSLASQRGWMKLDYEIGPHGCQSEHWGRTGHRPWYTGRPLSFSSSAI